MHNIYNTILKNGIKKYETTYNTILMLVRTRLILQHKYLQIDTINEWDTAW